MPLLPYGSPPPSRKTVYSPADFVVAPIMSGRKADYYTDGTDDQAEINTAITAANALTNGGTVELVNGIYTVSGSIIPLNNVWIRGQGMFGVRIGITSSANANIMGNRSVYNATNPYTNGIISDLTLDGSGLSTASTVGKGIDAVGVVNCKVMRLYVHDTVATGIGLDDYQSGTITECIVQSCGYNNKRVITAASWGANTFTLTTSTAHSYVAGAQATGLLTATGTIADGDTVTLDTTIYTFRTTLAAAYDVAIGGSNATALLNLSKAVNLTGTSGVNYGANTFKHPSATATTNTSTTQAFAAKAFSTSGNSIATTTTGGNASFGGTTLSGGVIGNKIVVAGMIPISYNGAFNVTSVIDATNFTIGTANNSGIANLTTDPGTATSFGTTSDSLIGHNGIGIASGALTVESITVTNNFCVSNQNNNYLIEVNAQATAQNASFIFSNNGSATAGQCGYRNTGTQNVQFNNNFDYGSPTGALIFPFASTRNITVASWSAGIATFTTSAAHGFPVGAKVTIDHITPTGYNGYYTIQSTPTTTTFTVNITSDPGTVLDLSAATALWIKNPTNGTQVIDNIFAYNQYFGLEVTNLGDEVSVKNNTVKFCFYDGMEFINANYAQITGNVVHGCGRRGIYLTSASYAQMEHTDVSHNTVYNNGSLASNTYDGIDVDSGTTAPIAYLTIHDNNVFDDRDTKLQRYGVILRSGGILNNIHVSDNNLSGNLTGGILVQDTSNTIYVFDNPGVNPQGKSDLSSVSGGVTFDSTLASFFTATFTGNVTATMPASPVAGTMMTWIIKQGGSGGNTLTLPGNTDTSGGLTLSTAVNAIDIVIWIYDLTTTKWRIAASHLATGTAISVVTKGANYTLTDADDIVKFNASGKILTFHDATAAKKKRYTIKNSSTGSMTFATTSSQTVDGSTTGTIIASQALEAVPDGSNWIIT